MSAQEQRERIACHVVTGILASKTSTVNVDVNPIVQQALKVTDSLIEELKKPSAAEQLEARIQATADRDALRAKQEHEAKIQEMREKSTGNQKKLALQKEGEDADE